MPKFFAPAVLLLAYFACSSSGVQAGEQKRDIVRRDGVAQKSHHRQCRCVTCRPVSPPHPPLCWLGPPPPRAPLLESAALLRSPARGRTTFSFRQESGDEDVRQESGNEDRRDDGHQESGGEKPTQKNSMHSAAGASSDARLDKMDARLGSLETDVRRLYTSVLELVDKLNGQTDGS